MSTPINGVRGAARLYRKQLSKRLANAGQEMVLWVLRENRRARDFYEHLGFQLDGAGNAKEFAPGFLIPQVRDR